MVIESVQLPFLEWLLTGLKDWFQVVGVLALVAFLLALLFASAARGPLAGWLTVRDGIGGILDDWRHTSLRRIWALTWLAFLESIRSRVLIAFAIFMVLILFASWYINPVGDRPARLFLDFVLTASNYLMLVVAIVLSTFSLPHDIKERTIYTVVSKPVRRNEILLGRIAGFSLTGTVLLVAMGVVSYFFVLRGLYHEHVLEVTRLETVPPLPGDENPVVKRGLTNREGGHGHRHIIEVRKDGTVTVDDTPGHTHEAKLTKIGDKEIYELGGPQDLLLARVPIYGDLVYLDRTGQVAKTGINVGKEWTYRSCIEGATKCAAVWKFEGLTPGQFPEGLLLELTQGVFRTYKGNIERGILGSITLRNPRVRTNETSPVSFSAREFYTQRFVFPHKLQGPKGELDLFKDLVDDGRLEVEIRCEEPAQYFCMAGPDLYLRAANASFEWNFAKGYTGIWLQMVLVTGVGVCWSTALRGAVAMLATASVTLLGFFTEFMVLLYSRNLPGGGPLEAMLRVLRQENPVVDLQPGTALDAAKVGDHVLTAMIYAAEHVVPNFLTYNDAAFVSNGFDISWALLAQHFISAAGHLIPVIIAGHFYLKYRQVAE